MSGLPPRRIDFAGINRAGLRQIDLILARWLPGGRREGVEYVVLNPRRPDKKPGSFKINTRSGAWADFAVGVKGRDIIGLAAYIFALDQGEAARRVAAMLGIDPYG